MVFILGELRDFHKIIENLISKANIKNGLLEKFKVTTH